MNNNAMQVMPNQTMAMPAAQVGGMMGIFADPQTFQGAMNMACALADSTIIPKDFQKNPSNCLIAIEMSARLNASPMMVMQNLFVVNGRPAWSSQWIVAMINQSRKYKTELQYEFGNDPDDGGLSCFAWAIDREGHKVVGPKITMKMAEAEGWVSKNGSKWKTMPQVMIQYRAASFFGRKNCPDMIMGIYSRDEVMETDYEDLDTDSAEAVSSAAAPSGEPALTAEDLAPVTQEQRQALFKLARDHFGADANDYVKAVLAEFNIGTTEGMPVHVYRKVLARAMELTERGAQEP